MREGIVFGRPVTMQGGPFALMEYRREFGSDLMADLLAAYREPGGDVVAFLQVAWAMARAADESVPPFPEWLRGFDSRLFTLGDAAGAVEVIDSAVTAELFRRRKAGGAARGIAGRLLGAVAHRARALQTRILQ